MAPPSRAILRLLTPLVAAAAVAAFYAQAAATNGFVFDDHIVIERQFPLRSWSDIKVIFTTRHYLDFPYYRPITRLTFAIQRSMPNPNNPFAYHLVNALLAGAVLLAAYGLLLRAMIVEPFPAILAAAWFSLHPAMSECVYPAASGRETLLPMFLMILAAWAWLRPTRGSFLAALAFLTLSLFSKEQAIVLPAIFLIADVLNITQTRPQTIRIWLLRYLPVILISLIYLEIRRRVLVGSTLTIDLFHHPLAPLQSILYSIQTAFTPFVALHYEPSFDVWFVPAFCVVSLLAFLILTTPVLKSPTRFLTLFWLAWFLLPQLPTAQIFVQDAPYSERYISLSMLALPALLILWLQRILTKPRHREFAAAIALLWIAALGVISFSRGSTYANDDTFTTQWYATDPHNENAHTGRGLVAQNRGDFPAAIAEYAAALAIDPSNLTAHTNLANLYLDDLHDPADALPHLQWLLEHTSANVSTMVKYAQVQIDLDPAHANGVRKKAALLWLQHAIHLDPTYAQAHNVLGQWYEQNADPQSAAREYQIALSLNPANADEIRQRLAHLQSSSPK